MRYTVNIRTLYETDSGLKDKFGKVIPIIAYEILDCERIIVATFWNNEVYAGGRCASNCAINEVRYLNREFSPGAMEHWEEVRLDFHAHGKTPFTQLCNVVEGSRYHNEEGKPCDS